MEKMYENILSKKFKLAVVGMGYVGFPLAASFAEHGVEVIGFDTNSKKIENYLKGKDPTREIGDERLKKISNIYFTSDEEKLKEVCGQAKKINLNAEDLYEILRRIY